MADHALGTVLTARILSVDPHKNGGVTVTAWAGAKNVYSLAVYAADDGSIPDLVGQLRALKEQQTARFLVRPYVGKDGFLKMKPISLLAG